MSITSASEGVGCACSAARPRLRLEGRPALPGSETLLELAGEDALRYD
jgi:hypothetical protein